MRKLPAVSDTTTGHHHQSGKGASANEISILLQVLFIYTQVSQPNSSLSPRHRRSVSPFPNPDSEKEEKVTNLLLGLQMEMVHRRIRCQHSTGIKNQEKGRKPLPLEAASHWSVQLHTAQRSKYIKYLFM